MFSKPAEQVTDLRWKNTKSTRDLLEKTTRDARGQTNVPTQHLRPQQSESGCDLSPGRPLDRGWKLQHERDLKCTLSSYEETAVTVCEPLLRDG